ncbi:MAG: urea ABC transporter permease subunit UrtC [Azospirillaceae bacterium]|nr:urea ABC transporter permease subunit UrtC [Azospirillaceae bacterium]
MSLRKTTLLAGLTISRQMVLTLGVMVLAALAPWLVSAYELNLLARFLAMGLLAMGLVLVWGQGGILSLGQGVFFGLGGYAIALHMKLAALGDGELPDFMVWSGLDALPWWWVPFRNPLVALAGVVLVPGVVAAAFSWSVFRRRVGGVYFALITQALALAFATLLISQQPSTGGFNGLTDFQTLFGVDLGDAAHGLYWLTLALVAGVFLALRALMASRYGMLLRAIRDGENRIRFLGYDPTPFKVVAFTIGAVLAGLAGALFTLHAGVVSPALVGVVPSIEMVIWVAVGGRNSLAGAVAGTLLINLAKDGVSSAFPDLWLYALGLVFVLVVTLLPGGLAGLVTDAGASVWGRRLKSIIVGDTK